MKETHVFFILSDLCLHSFTVLPVSENLNNVLLHTAHCRSRPSSFTVVVLSFLLGLSCFILFGGRFFIFGSSFPLFVATELSSHTLKAHSILIFTRAAFGTHWLALADFIFFFVLVLSSGSREGRDVSIYECTCIDIFILVYSLHHLIFSCR
jgi:hypothetical protein